MAVLLGGCQALAPVSAPTSTSLPPTETIAPPTATPLPPTDTPEPTLPPATSTPTLEPLSGAVWSAENAASAQYSEMLLPDYPVGVYWPGNTSVLVYLNSSFLNVDLDPLASGVTIPVNAPGNILGIAPDGAELIYQGGDGGLMRWERATQASTVIPFGGAVYFANYSQDGQTIAFGSVDEMKVTLYDRASLEPFQTLSGFSTAAPVYSVVPGPGRGLVAWVARAKLQLQDVNNSSLGGELGYQDFIVAIAFSPDGSKLAIISGGLLQVINASVQADITAQDLILSTMDAPVTAVTFSPDGALVAAAVGKDVLIWETATWARVTALPHRNPVRLVSFSPDGRALVVVDDAHVLRSWRVQ